MEESSVAFRLKSLIEALGLTDSQFADRCSISRPTLSLLLSGKNKKISDVLLSQIHEAFPEVSILWLLFGEGEKFKTEEPEPNHEKNETENSIFKGKDRDDSEQLNLVNVKQLETIIQNVVNKTFETNFIGIEQLVLKNQEPLLQRKVNKITVYYDDSTFETFTPESIRQ